LSFKVWRNAVEDIKYPASDLSGTGAKITGGRWNHKGTPLVYCSTNVALTVFETLNAIISGGAFPYNRFLVEIDIPDDVWHAAVDGFTAPVGGWDALPSGYSSRKFGTDWANSRFSAVLKVPSVFVPEEMNVLINPLHPDASRISARTGKRWIYDPRLFG
jgi:RES domain-containing protein